MSYLDNQDPELSLKIFRELQSQPNHKLLPLGVPLGESVVRKTLEYERLNYRVQLRQSGNLKVSAEMMLYRQRIASELSALRMLQNSLK